jgi:hypothetical protein
VQVYVSVSVTMFKPLQTICRTYGTILSVCSRTCSMNLSAGRSTWALNSLIITQVDYTSRARSSILSPGKAQSNDEGTS